MMQSTIFRAVQLDSEFHWRKTKLLKTAEYRAAHPETRRGNQWVFSGNEQVQVKMPDDDEIDYYGPMGIWANIMNMGTP